MKYSCIMTTTTVNLRSLPVDFVRRAKAFAALSGLTLKDFFIQAVEREMQREIPISATPGALLSIAALKKRMRAARR
jgi:hypothetical protein